MNLNFYSKNLNANIINFYKNKYNIYLLKYKKKKFLKIITTNIFILTLYCNLLYINYKYIYILNYMCYNYKYINTKTKLCLKKMFFKI